ncbi:unnamed protein product [Merluccius merluccius]
MVGEKRGTFRINCFANVSSAAAAAVFTQGTSESTPAAVRPMLLKHRRGEGRPESLYNRVLGRAPGSWPPARRKQTAPDSVAR